MNERPTTPRPWRPPRLGDSGAPITTIVVLAAAAVAVVIGLVILGSVGEPAEGPDEIATASTSTTVPATSSPATTTSTSTTTTTTTPPSKTDAPIFVANASGIGGSATAMGEELEGDGYVVSEVGNSTGPRLDESIIYFADDPRSRGVAQLLAEQIPTANTVPMPAQPPLDRPLGDATVALLVGIDAAGRSLDELADG